MYPLNMILKDGIGFACANDESEHKTLSDAGYEPKFEESLQDVEAPKKRGRPAKVE
jgi:hypothetical protein